MSRPKRSTEDFAEEVRAHLEFEADELRSEGLSAEEALRRAHVEFGSVRTAKERFYLRSRIQWLDTGPPKTQTPPENGSRFYRVLETQ